jgi:hypothetical protein
MHYESLEYYAGALECEVTLGGDESRSDITVFDRDLRNETMSHYVLLFGIPRAEAETILARHGAKPTCAGLNTQALDELQRHITGAVTWRTRHPSCSTLLRWLPEIGFSEATATYDGGWFARHLFDTLPACQRPRQMKEIDDFLRPLVEVVVTMNRPVISRPGEWDPWVSATK